MPFTRPGALLGQRLTVRVGGVAIGNALATRRTVLAFRVPGELFREGPELSFDHPDAARPSDVVGGEDRRFLAFSFTRLRLFRIAGFAGPQPFEHHTILSDAELLSRFESLGDNCEFGLVQRCLGIEPLSLLRFSGQPLDLLVKAIDDGFHQLENPANVEVDGSTTSGEYSLYIRPYGIHYHTFIKTHEMDADALRQKQMSRIKLLRRLLLEGISEAAKIYVFKRNDNLSFSEMLPLFASLNRRGPATLLFARPADDRHPPGAVELLLPGLICGYVSSFGNYQDAKPVAVSDWVNICREALALVANPARNEVDARSG